MGALLFTNETYRETLPIIDASGITAMPAANPGNNTWLYDYEHGTQRGISSIPNITSDPVFQAEIDRYTSFWNDEFAPFISIGYKVREDSQILFYSQG